MVGATIAYMVLPRLFGAAVDEVAVVLEGGAVQEDNTVELGNVGAFNQDEDKLMHGFTVIAGARYQARHVSGVAAKGIIFS